MKFKETDILTIKDFKVFFNARFYLVNARANITIEGHSEHLFLNEMRPFQIFLS